MHATILKFLFFAFGYSLIASDDQQQIANRPALSDPRVVLENLRQFYDAHDYIYHELSYTLFSDHRSQTPYSVDKGIFIRNGHTRYAQLASIESLTTAEYTVGVDHDDRMAIIANLISLPPTAEPVDQLKAWTTNPGLLEVQYVSEQHDLLLVKTEYGEVEQAELWYDKTTFQPVKMIFKYRRSIVLETDADGDPVQPRMEIEYLQTGFNGQGRERLNLNTYVVQEAGKWVLSPALQGYELIVNIHPSPLQN